MTAFNDNAEDDVSRVSFSVFVTISALNFFRIGYQLVVAGWLAVQITGRVSAAGYILLISTLANLFFSPVIGKLVDTYKNKKNLVIVGQLGVAFSGLTPLAGGLFLSSENRFPVLVATLSLATVFTMLAGSAMDYFIKSYIPATARLQRLASLNIVTQIALIIGTGIGGVIVSQLGDSAGFLPISICGLMAGFLCAYLLPNLTITAVDVELEKPFFGVGPMMYFQYPSLFSVACCAALVFSVGQITNTLLPALINLYLHRSSVSYSFAEAAWSIGAFCMSVIFVNRIKNSFGQNKQDLALIAGMACLLAVIPQLQSFITLLGAHLLLGAGFAFVRIRSETRFLTICPMALLGRFRANGLFLTSFIGLLVFSTPIFFDHLSIPMLYVLLSGIVLLSTLAILFFAKMRHRNLIKSDLFEKTRENQ